ncbi:uncharacterized protein LOC133796544 [Humulus lupulus]|uniref:uncharacterized protein LOC133796544 n=1 Tax=Humulus lupulus TaxID=3486 RepID=UPI002B408A83|nr:uncharacterized protein LOC133796544 [Humulus lupulus]
MVDSWYAENHLQRSEYEDYYNDANPIYPSGLVCLCSIAVITVSKHAQLQVYILHFETNACDVMSYMLSVAHSFAHAESFCNDNMIDWNGAGIISLQCLSNYCWKSVVPFVASILCIRNQ